MRRLRWVSWELPEGAPISRLVMLAHPVRRNRFPVLNPD